MIIEESEYTFDHDFVGGGGDGVAADDDNNNIVG